MTEYRFAFGRPLLSVRSENKGKRRIFVVGVYPSALHARWIDPNGKQLCAAMAIDNEPESFWKGEGAASMIADISRGLPEVAGSLVEPAATFNGPSGVALDRMYLEPLNLTRTDCWITDLQNTYLANPS